MLAYVISIGIVAMSTLLMTMRSCAALRKQSLNQLSKSKQKWTVGTNQPPPFDSADWSSFDPADLKKSGGTYGLVISSIIPRPIALISSMDSNGVLNCAPYSYFGCMGHDPPLVSIGICTIGSPATKKDTLNNIEQTGQFVVNIMSEWYADSANHCSGSFPADANEMDVAGLTNVPSLIVKPPRVGEAAVQFECEVVDLKPVHNDSGHHTVTIVLGRVLRFHIKDEVLTAGSKESGKPTVDWQKLKPLGRLGGNTYSTIGEVFDLQRPKIV